MKKYVVLGGGISGLSAAWKLSSSNRADVTLIERNERVGGWIQSKRTDHGSVFELGPRSLRIAGVPGRQTLNLVCLLKMYLMQLSVITMDFEISILLPFLVNR